MHSLHIVFTDRDRVEVREERAPEIAADQVLVQASKTLISTGTEGIVLGRHFDPGTHWDAWVKYPFSPGYSFAGRVVAIGSEVTNLGEGDRVAVRGPHRQHIAVPADRIYRVPDDVSDEDATWFGLANIVQNGVRRAEHRLGDDVAVIGLGLLGQLVVQYARLLGARQVIAVDLVERRLEMAQGHGATTALAMSADEARERVLDLTNNLGADLVYDVTGAAPVFPAALRLLRRFGRLVLLGDTGTPGEQRLTGDVVTKGLTIVGAHDSNPPPASSDHAYWSHQRMTDLFFTYLLRGDMRVSDLVTHRYAPREAADAYRMLREDRGSAMGVIFDWSGDPAGV
jgi:2-desacetyl-2-hydroxyethyl bacteriochlorophyllide A dehydrogenase